jgi:hypothetical protein
VGDRRQSRPRPATNILWWVISRPQVVKSEHQSRAGRGPSRAGGRSVCGQNPRLCALAALARAGRLGRARAESGRGRARAVSLWRAKRAVCSLRSRGRDQGEVAISASNGSRRLKCVLYGYRDSRFREDLSCRIRRLGVGSEAASTELWFTGAVRKQSERK